MSAPSSTFFRRHRWLVWLGSAALFVVVALAVVAAVIARRIEPFLRAQIVAALSDRLHARVELDQFHVALASGMHGQWGIVAQGRGLRIWPARPDAPADPFIQLDEFNFHAPLRYQSGKPIVISLVRLSGLTIHVPPRVQHPPSAPQPSGSTTTSALARVVVERMECDHAELTLASSRPDKLPIGFTIQQLRLAHIAAGQPVEFQAQVINPRPTGIIRTSGHFGPWLLSDPGASPVSGTYQFDHADLASFRDISGTLSSTGTYTGTLRDLTVDGESDVPNFALERFSSPLPLHTRFHARVDGTDGDVWLDQVQATLGRSRFTTHGHIVRMRTVLANGGIAPVTVQERAALPSVGGHDILLDIDMHDQRLDDVLRFTSQQQQPLLTGIVTLQAHLHIPPGPDKVLRRLALDGNFNLEQAQFMSDKIQSKVDELSLRGQGRPGDVHRPQAAGVDSAMQSHFTVAQAIVTLPDLVYTVPGAHIQLKGTYGLEEGSLNFDGTARMDATVSQMVGGWKGLLLKPADRLFKKDGAGTSIPIHVTGTRQSPHFSADLPFHGPATHPQRPGEPTTPTPQAPSP
ncbi:MAG: AsmA-like C-terminal region-containing protein [Terracidiphilus sp.]|nr:AsmA-like C-terminal region-containing protein [Terracidiphilus sp.]